MPTSTTSNPLTSSRQAQRCDDGARGCAELPSKALDRTVDTKAADTRGGGDDPADLRVLEVVQVAQQDDLPVRFRKAGECVADFVTEINLV